MDYHSSRDLSTILFIFLSLTVTILLILTYQIQTKYAVVPWTTSVKILSCSLAACLFSYLYGKSRGGDVEDATTQDPPPAEGHREYTDFSSSSAPNPPHFTNTEELGPEVDSDSEDPSQKLARLRSEHEVLYLEARAAHLASVEKAASREEATNRYNSAVARDWPWKNHKVLRIAKDTAEREFLTAYREENRASLQAARKLLEVQQQRREVGWGDSV